MGIFDFVLRRGQPRTSNPRVVYLGQGSADVLKLSPEELYRRQPALNAVVDFLARNVAQLPLKVYETDGVDRKRSRDSAAALTIGRPNATTTTYQLLDRTMHDLKLRGWALWYVFESETSESGFEIQHIPAAWVTDWETRTGFDPSSYRVTSPYSNNTVTLDAAQCVRFSYYKPGDPAGATSPVEALKDVLSEQISSWKFRNQIWAQGGRTTSYLYRPAGVQWSDEAFERFRKEWHEYSGNGGSYAGRTPILEDGMELRTTSFNAHELDWVNATQLSRQDVAGVYHVNPQMIWAGERQTYASAKDNARMLYADTLAPDLKMISDQVNAVLLPLLGSPSNLYAEFDLQAKLNGAFEDQAAMLTSAVGAPWMMPSEARARMNLPYIEGTDVFARPLNTDFVDDGEDADLDVLSGAPLLKAAPVELKTRGTATTDDVLEIAGVMRRFFKRQGKAVTSKIDNPKMRETKAGDDFPAWWEADRWNRELADDLEPVFLKQATADIERVLAHLGLHPLDFDPVTIKAYIRKTAEAKARATNDVTYRQLLEAIEGELSEEAEGATPQGVFEKAETDRADMQGRSFATALAGFACVESVRQQASDRKATKTWIVTSANPRTSHAAMNGETVGIDEPFSNGANMPGDHRLSADETCNCCCEVEITLY